MHTMQPPAVPLTIFPFPENTKEKYLTGGCWILALKLNQVLDTGYRAIVVGQETYHVGVRLGGSLVVDIQGIWTEEQWEWNWMNASSTNYPSIEDPDEDALEMIHGISEYDHYQYNDSAELVNAILEIITRYKPNSM